MWASSQLTKPLRLYIFVLINYIHKVQLIHEVTVKPAVFLSYKTIVILMHIMPLATRHMYLFRYVLAVSCYYEMDFFVSGFNVRVKLQE